MDKLKDSNIYKVEISSDHALIKIFKGIYRWFEDQKPDLVETCINKFLGDKKFVEKLSGCFSNPELANSVLKNMQKLECEDTEFKKFKEQLKDYIFEDGKFANNQKKYDYIDLADRCMQFRPSCDNDAQTKISRMKLFLLISTVISFVAIIFFMINLILTFLAIT